MYTRHPELVLGEHNFYLTCGACPEQYDVLDTEGNMLAYIRLRGGAFRVSCPDVGGEDVLYHDFNEEYKGTFEDEAERLTYLIKANDAIKTYYNRKATW